MGRQVRYLHNTVARWQALSARKCHISRITSNLAVPLTSIQRLLGSVCDEPLSVHTELIPGNQGYLGFISFVCEIVDITF